MVVLIDEILHIPLPGVPVQCNYQFCRASNTSYIPWPPLLNLILHVLLFTVTLTTANIPPKGQLSVLTVPLNIAFPHSKSFTKTICVIKLKCFVLVSEHLPNNLIVKIHHFLLHPSTTLNQLNIHTANSHQFCQLRMQTTKKKTFRSNYRILS